jgi:hypothetical protein
MGAAGSRAIAASAELLDRAALLSEPTSFQRYGIGSPMLNDCCRLQDRPLRKCSLPGAGQMWPRAPVRVTD